MNASVLPSLNGSSDSPVLVLGGGIAGMGAAWGLLRKGINNTLIFEKHPNLGGLLTTIEWEGCYLDHGPHRIHSENKEILKTVLELLEGEIVTVHRKSRMRLCGRFIDYPQRMAQVLAALGPARSSRVMGSYLAHFFQSTDGTDSMENYFTQRFGRALYELVLRDYARKVWLTDPAQLSADMSRQRVASNSLLHTIRDTLFPSDQTYLRHFPYPRHGIGTLADKVEVLLSKGGVQWRTGVEVKSINLDEQGVESVTLNDGDLLVTLPGACAISTLPLPILIRLIKPAPPKDVLDAAYSLEYSSLVLVYILLDQPQMGPDTWLYFPEASIPFSRLYELANWSRTLVPEGRTCLCVEVPCKAGDTRWNAPGEETEALVVDGLADMGLFKKDKVLKTRSVKAPNIYPIYTLDYRAKLDVIFDYLRTIPNLVTTGRGGLFRHNNLDHALDTGLAAGEHLADNPNGAREWYDGLHRFEHYRIVD